LEEKKDELRLPPLVSVVGRRILGNSFVRIDRSGKIIKPQRDNMGSDRWRKEVDSGSIHIPDAIEVGFRNVREAVDNVRAEQVAFRAAQQNPL